MSKRKKPANPEARFAINHMKQLHQAISEGVVNCPEPTEDELTEMGLRISVKLASAQQWPVWARILRETTKIPEDGIRHLLVEWYRQTISTDGAGI